MSLECITCSRTLHERELDGVTIDLCLMGHGAWLEPGEFDQIVINGTASPDSVKRALAARPADDTVEDELKRKQRPCPVCGEEMLIELHADWSNVVLDHCEAHGTWFDENEVERAVTWERARTAAVTADDTAHSAIAQLQAAEREREETGFLARLLALLRLGRG